MKKLLCFLLTVALTFNSFPSHGQGRGLVNEQVDAMIDHMQGKSMRDIPRAILPADPFHQILANTMEDLAAPCHPIEGDQEFCVCSDHESNARLPKSVIQVLTSEVNQFVKQGISLFEWNVFYTRIAFLLGLHTGPKAQDSMAPGTTENARFGSHYDIKFFLLYMQNLSSNLVAKDVSADGIKLMPLLGEVKKAAASHKCFMEYLSNRQCTFTSMPDLLNKHSLETPKAHIMATWNDDLPTVLINHMMSHKLLPMGVLMNHRIMAHDTQMTPFGFAFHDLAHYQVFVSDDLPFPLFEGKIRQVEGTISLIESYSQSGLYKKTSLDIAEVLKIAYFLVRHENTDINKEYPKATIGPIEHALSVSGGCHCSSLHAQGSHRCPHFILTATFWDILYHERIVSMERPHGVQTQEGRSLEANLKLFLETLKGVSDFHAPRALAPQPELPAAPALSYLEGSALGLFAAIKAVESADTLAYLWHKLTGFDPVFTPDEWMAAKVTAHLLLTSTLILFSGNKDYAALSVLGIVSFYAAQNMLINAPQALSTIYTGFMLFASAALMATPYLASVPAAGLIVPVAGVASLVALGYYEKKYAQVLQSAVEKIAVVASMVMSGLTLKSTYQTIRSSQAPLIQYQAMVIGGFAALQILSNSLWLWI
jgi:hypothetical protein